MIKRLSSTLLSLLLLAPHLTAHSEESNYVAAFYYAQDLTNESGILVVHDGGKPKTIKNASLVKCMEEMYQKKWVISQSNRGPSKTGDYEVVYMVFTKAK